MVHQIRGQLLEYGIVIPQGIARLRKRLPRVIEEAEKGLPLVLRDLLQRLQSELRTLDTQMTDITGQLARLSHKLEACQCRQERKGIWALRETALVAALGTEVTGDKWYSLMNKVCAPRTLEVAWKRVAANKGAAGVDGISIARIALPYGTGKGVASG
jgi:hypothetical protein